MIMKIAQAPEEVEQIAKGYNHAAKHHAKLLSGMSAEDITEIATVFISKVGFTAFSIGLAVFYLEVANGRDGKAA